MMGDGAAMARLSRQHRTQRTRRGPASAPQATRASIVALPGSACHPEVAGCALGSARLAPALHSVPRSPYSIALASRLLGAQALITEVPIRTTAAGACRSWQSFCISKVLNAHRASSHPGKSGCSGNKGGQTPDVAGWAGRVLAAPGGEGRVGE